MSIRTAEYTDYLDKKIEDAERRIPKLFRRYVAMCILVTLVLAGTGYAAAGSHGAVFLASLWLTYVFVWEAGCKAGIKLQRDVDKRADLIEQEFLGVDE
jgi:fatty acid desaturase